MTFKYSRAPYAFKILPLWYRNIFSMFVIEGNQKTLNCLVFILYLFIIIKNYKLWRQPSLPLESTPLFIIASQPECQIWLRPLQYAKKAHLTQLSYGRKRKEKSIDLVGFGGQNILMEISLARVQEIVHVKSLPLAIATFFWTSLLVQKTRGKRNRKKINYRHYLKIK